MIVQIERRELDLFMLDAPNGVTAKSWWTVDAKAPEPDAVVDPTQVR